MEHIPCAEISEAASHALSEDIITENTIDGIIEIFPVHSHILI